MKYEDAIQKFLVYLEAQDRARKTIYGYARDLAVFRKFYEQLYNVPWLVEETTTEDVEAFLQMLYQVRGLQPASRNRILHCLKSFYKYLHSRGICPRDPTYGVNSVRIHRQERPYLTESEYIKVINAIHAPVIRLATETLWYTGLRISELTHLCIGNVDLPNKTIHVIGKGNDKRDVPIHPKLLPMLRDYKSESRSAASSTDRFFALESTGAISPSHYTRELHRAVEKLGLPKKVTAHVFRHSFASNLVRKGVHLVVIQRLLGHKSIGVTAVYTHANIDSMAEAVNLL